MRNFLLALLFAASFQSVTAQLNADFTWCPVYDTTGQICCIQFINLSTDSTGTIVSYFWDFGDGSTASLMEPLHCYPMLGTYLVGLFVTNNNGNIDTAFHTVVISSLDSTNCDCDSLISTGGLTAPDISVRLVPNPFTERTYFTIQTVKILLQPVLDVYDPLGQLVWQKQLPSISGNLKILFERETLPAGFYLFNLHDQSGITAAGKFIIE